MTTLLITLPLGPLDTATQFEYILSTDGNSVTTHACGQLNLLPTLPDKQADVVALVPAQALSWHLVHLPKGSLLRNWMTDRGASRLRAILEGLLEEQLLDDPSELHLAIQPQPHADQPLWVAACDRAWLKAGLQALALAGYEAHRIIPESTPETSAHTLYVMGDEDQALLMGGSSVLSADLIHLGRSVLVCPLSASSMAWLNSQSDPADVPELVAEPAVATLAEHLFKRPVTLQHRSVRLLRAAQTQWDMAQFDLQNTRRDRRFAYLMQGATSVLRAPRWRPARWAMVLLVLCHVIGLNAFAWREQTALQTKRLAVQNVLTDTFPKIPVVVDAPVQMAREVAALQRLSGAVTESDLEIILASFSAVAPAGIALSAIDYVAPELRIKCSAPSAPQQSAMIFALHQQRLAAQFDGTQWVIQPVVKP